MLVINLLASIFLGNALDTFFAAINSVQILFYVPLIDVPFDSIVYTAFSYLSYANLENTLVSDPLSSNLDWSKVKDGTFNSAFDNYGYSSQIFLKNYRYKFGLWLILLSGFPVVIILGRFKHKFFNQFRKLKHFYLFNGVLKIMCELYLEMGIYAYLNVFSIQFRPKEGLITTVIAFAGMVWIMLFPILAFNII